MISTSDADPAFLIPYPMKHLSTFFLTGCLVVGLGYLGLGVFASDATEKEALLNAMLTEIDTYRSDWIVRRPERYRYSVLYETGSGIPPRKYDVVVKGETRTSRFSDASDRSLNEIPDDPVSVEDIFNTAEQYLLGGYGPSRITIHVDDDYGFPIFASFGTDCADCGETIRIIEFRSLE